MDKKINHVMAILYHKIQESDFTNMYEVKKPKGGGGQTYIQAAGYTHSDLDEMFKEADAVDTPEYWDADKNHPRKKYTLTAHAVGSIELGDLELAPRTGRKDYRISRQNPKHRHPAWSQDHGFPAPDRDETGKYIYEKNYPNKIDHLYIMIIKTCSNQQEIQYYATYVDSKVIPEGWPRGAGLETIFSGEKQGIIFYDEQFLRFTDNRLIPFSPGSAVDAELGNILLPENLTNSTDDAVEYATKDLDLTVDIKAVEFVSVEPPTPKRRVNTGGSGGIVKDKDYVRRQRNLKRIGDLGEALVLEIEKRRLTEAGRKDLADQIAHVSKTIGDGLGYDIKSFELIGDTYVETCIEVKATTGGKNKPFDISANEVEVSADKQNNYIIYRLFGLGNGAKEVKYYKIRGSVAEQFTLIPTIYKAYVK